MSKRLGVLSLSSLPRLLAAGMLVWALDRHAYDYYTLMRWVVCGTAAYLTWIAIETERSGGAWTFGVMALLFNPIIPVHLSRSTWQPIDLASAVLIVISIFWIQPGNPEGDNYELLHEDSELLEGDEGADA